MNDFLHGVLDTVSQINNFSCIWFVIGVATGVALLALILIIDKKFNK